MKKMRLFQYAIIWHPTEKEAENGKQSEVIVNVSTKLAIDDRALLIQVSREIPDLYLSQLDQVEIAIRPF